MDKMRPVQATKLKKPPSEVCLAQYEAMLTPPQKFIILTSKYYQRLSFTKYVNLTMQENLRAPGTEEM